MQWKVALMWNVFDVFLHFLMFNLNYDAYETKPSKMQI